MGRKVFVSFLGASNYGECDYQKDGKSYGKTRFIQEATLNMLMKQETWTKDDVAFILLTQGAETANWVDNGQKDRKTGEPLLVQGLQSRLNQFPMTIDTIKKLPDGNNEEEIWTIFERTFEEIKDGDDLYFDMTHGYRYLPMLILVLGNYSKFLKGVKVRSITYGNYEISDRGKKPGLIVDLLPLSMLQDWAYAAGQYLDSGNTNKLIELSKNDDKLNCIMDSLQNVIYERQLCRGISIIESTTFKELKDSMMALVSTDIRPLNPIFDKIKQSFSAFDEEENVKNGYAASKWCYQNKLYQQTITILLETMFTDVCVSLKLNWKRRKIRDIASSSFYIVAKNIPESGWNLKEKEGCTKYEKEKELYLSITKSERIRDLLDLYNLASIIRNDMDHAGMRENALSPDGLIEEFDKLIEKIPC